MALIQCKECGKEVSNQAKACPHCGLPFCDTIEIEIKRESKKKPNILKSEIFNNNYWLVPFILIIVAIILIFAIFLPRIDNDIKASDKMITLGIAALETVDDYLDGKITLEEASSRMSGTKFSAEYQSDRDLDELNADTVIGTKYSDNSSIDHHIFFLDYRLFEIESGVGTKAELIDERNELADLLHKKKR